MCVCAHVRAIFCVRYFVMLLLIRMKVREIIVLCLQKPTLGNLIPDSEMNKSESVNARIYHIYFRSQASISHNDT